MKISLLTPGDVRHQIKSVPLDAAEPPANRKAPGEPVRADVGHSGGTLLVSAFLPGVGWVTGAGLLAEEILRAAGARIDALRDGSPEDEVTEGLPEAEIFVYEDLLRKGRSVVIALAEDGTAEPIRQSLRQQGADAIEAARQEWWTGLRDGEREHYSASGGDFVNDEKFYRLGFEAALHARTRCKEFDQVSAEMDSKLEDLEEQYPGAQIEEPFTRGYQRGREHFQALCDERAA